MRILDGYLLRTRTNRSLPDAKEKLLLTVENAAATLERNSRPRIRCSRRGTANRAPSSYRIWSEVTQFFCYPVGAQEKRSSVSQRRSCRGREARATCWGKRPTKEGGTLLAQSAPFPTRTSWLSPAEGLGSDSSRSRGGEKQEGRCDSNTIKKNYLFTNKFSYKNNLLSK